jgi:uncharacterized protein (TIGR02246 family)
MIEIIGHRGTSIRAPDVQEDAGMGEQADPHADDAVRALYEQLMNGWNEGSGAAFAAPFLDDGHLIAFDGTHFEDRAQIAAFQQELFEKFLKGTRLVGSVQGVRFLGPDVALLHAVGGTILRGKSKPARERDSIQTLVAVRDGGGLEARSLPEHPDPPDAQRPSLPDHGTRRPPLAPAPPLHRPHPTGTVVARLSGASPDG